MFISLVYWPRSCWGIQQGINIFRPHTKIILSARSPNFAGVGARGGLRFARHFLQWAWPAFQFPGRKLFRRQAWSKAPTSPLAENLRPIRKIHKDVPG